MGGNYKRFGIDGTERLLRVGAKVASTLISVLDDPLGYDADIFFPEATSVYDGSDNSVKYPVLPTISRRVIIGNIMTERFHGDITLDVYNEQQPTLWIEREYRIPRYSKVVVKVKRETILQFKVQYEAGMYAVDNEMFHKYPLVPMSAVATGAPEIDDNPMDTVFDVGSTGELEVIARGAEPLEYQWYKGDEKIEGATGNRLFFETVTMETAGDYRCVVSNEVGTNTTYPAHVSVANLPIIVTQPEGGRYPEGSKVTLSVEVTGDPPLRYQWYHNGEKLYGKNNSTLVIPNAHQWDNGDYCVRVTNLTGLVESDTVHLYIT